MVTVASQPPIRTPSGGTTDQIFQPLADCGNGNPFFYHMFSDDFDQNFSFTTANTYTITAAGTSSFLPTSADGGWGLFTTGAVNGNAETIQVVTPSFTVSSQPKKVFFETRIKATSPTSAMTVVAGLISTNTTPYTSVADGVYFLWNSTTLTINSTKASAVTAVTIPASAYTWVNGSTMDIAFYITRLGDVLAYVDTQLVGFIPQSNIGTTNNPQNAGAVSRITAPSLTTAVLAPTLSVQTNATGAATLQVDFIQAQKER